MKADFTVCIYYSKKRMVVKLGSLGYLNQAGLFTTILVYLDFIYIMKTYPFTYSF